MDTMVADPLHGALLGGRYRIMGRLARGGMATVYQARDERLERTVAIKIIHPDRTRDRRFLDWLADEAKTVARLAHPNVVAVYDQGTHHGAPYLVMEFVRGRTLREVLNERRRLDPSESLAVLEQILAALAVAHRIGLVHRDVKPENILIAPPPNGSGDLVDSVVKVADFGLAHAVEQTRRPSGRPNPSGGPEATLLGTVDYAAPELISGARADTRSDVYSTGIVLFEMLTGRVPFEGDHPADVARQHVERDVPAPSRIVPGLPPLVDTIVARATHRNPASRPRDAGAMLAEVQAARDDISALVEPTRAIAHPTVMVPQVSPAFGGPTGQPRPPWARLPSARKPMTPAARISADARQRVADLVASRSVQRAWDTVRHFFQQLPATPRGRQQLTGGLVAVVLMLLVGGWWLGFGRYTETPKLVDFTRGNAVAEATRLGFTLDFGAGIYAEDVPIDTVIRQQPGVGESIVKGSTITVYLSLGPERYPVPELAGQAADVATAQLKAAKFVVQTQSGYSDTLPVNYVVGTNPPAGTQLKPNSIVKLIIAKGPYPIHVPSLVGAQLAEAEAQLSNLGFQVEVQRRDDQTKPRDQVLEQTPTGGQGLASAKGVKVVLVVANGPAGPPMPGVVSWRCSDAVNHLRGMGLNVNANGNDFERFFWTVKAQRPEPNTPLQPGQSVDLECG